ncbi:MAG: hypothetical protein NTV49_13840 [Kiritimatiellaeota bacterium]|nr:hypothetical protein [Kiritimatiellota bacterium]
MKPDVAGSKPFSYTILVQPVLDKNCVGCHTRSKAEGKQCPDLSRGNNGDASKAYSALSPFAQSADLTGMRFKKNPSHNSYA